MNAEHTTPVHDQSVLGKARAALLAATETAERTATAVDTLHSDVARLEASVARLEQVDASGPLDSRHELSLLQSKRELTQKIAKLTAARLDLQTATRDLQTARADVHRYETDLAYHVRSLASFADLNAPELQHVTLAQYRSLKRLSEEEVHRLAGAPA